MSSRDRHSCPGRRFDMKSGSSASRSPPSSCPSPRKHALACLHLLLPHPQAGADGEKGRLNYPQREF